MKSFYEQIGFTIVAEQKLSDTVHRLMALDSEVFQAVENDRSSDEILRLQNALRISLTRSLIGTVPSAMWDEYPHLRELGRRLLGISARPQFQSSLHYPSKISGLPVAILFHPVDKRQQAPCVVHCYKQRRPSK